MTENEQTDGDEQTDCKEQIVEPQEEVQEGPQDTSPPPERQGQQQQENGQKEQEKELSLRENLLMDIENANEKLKVYQRLLDLMNDNPGFEQRVVELNALMREVNSIGRCRGRIGGRI